MHGLIIGSSNDICSLFDSYLLNHEASTHEITWRMFSTQLRISSKKNQIKRSSYVIVMLFTNQVIFSSREFRPPEKLEMANLLSDEPTVNSIMPKVIIHDEETSIMSTFMKSQLCFDSSTSPAPLSSELQEYCEEPSFLNSLPDMFVKISTHDVIRFGLDKMKEFCVSKSVFDNMINSFKPDLVCSKYDKTWHLLKSFRDQCVVLSLDDIVVYNTFFENYLESLIFDSKSELKLVCSDVGKDMPILKMTTVVEYLDKILVCNIYFDEHLERLKNVQFVLGKDILICDLNKYLSCTFDPGLLVFVLSIQERQVQPLNESIGRAQQPQIWRSFVVQTGYLGASDRGSVQERYRNSTKVFCLESNFTRKPTHQGFTEAWNHMKIFTDEDVMNFPNRRFFSPSIREYQISKGDSCPRKNRPEPKPILHEPKVFPQSTSWPNQKHWGHDTPRSTDQYMEPNQPGDQNVLNISTEVHVFHRTGQTDRAVYWTVPHTSGKELWLEPWPDDRSDHTGACLSRPTSHLKTYGRARIHFGRAGRGDTYFGELDELSELSDTTLELDELSELNDTSLELNELSNTEDGAGSAAGRNGPFQPKEKFIKSSLWDCFFPNSTSPFLSPFQAQSPHDF
uniref:Uncharacterized protein n=1 Tax=Brassica campestris TaxID=3711 RepID=M4DNW1_BRACM